MRVIKNALKVIPPAPVQSNGNGHHQEHDFDEIADRIKKALEAEKEKENPFPLDSFPKPIKAIIEHWHKVYRRPVDFHGGSMLGAFSAAIGNAFQVEYVQGSVQPLAVWSVIIGPPSSAKSPIMRTCMRPLFEKEKQFRKDLDDDLAQWEIDKAKAIQDKAKEPKKPELQQRITNDATIEALIKVLMQQKCWKGICAFKDEFIGLLKGMNAYKTAGQDLEHYLSMWSGMPITLNRSGMEYAAFLESPFVAMLGSIQPGVLSGLTDGGKIANGFLYRLLFSFPENVQIPLPSGEVPRQEMYDQYAKIIHRLYDLPNHEERQPTTLRMNTEAFKIYEKYKTDVEQNIINKTDDEDIQSLYGKVVDYVLRIAAILELVEYVSQGDDRFFEVLSHADIEKIKITKTAINRAIILMEYFTRNSLKILMRTESPVAQLNSKNRKLYEELPQNVKRADAIGVGEKLNISEKTVRRLIYNKSLFKQNPDGSYRKLYS